MHYGFDEVEETFAGEIGRWAQKVLAPHYQSDDKAATFRRQQAIDMAQMGLTSLRIPEEYGGQDASAVIAGIAAEQVGRADFNAGYLIINTALISDILVRNCTDEQKQAWLPGIADGSTVPCIMITEPGAGTDAAALALKATPDTSTSSANAGGTSSANAGGTGSANAGGTSSANAGGTGSANAGGTSSADAGWRLDGEKTSITLGMAADHAVVLARTGGPGARGVSAFWVDLSDPGITRSAFDDLGSRAIGRASIHFDGVRVGPDDLIGAEGAGFVSVMQGFDYSRAIIGLLCLGAAEESLDEAAQWARDRKAFDRPIGTFQGVSFPLAECATYIQGAKHVCYEALWRKDNDLEHNAEAAMAKFWAPKLATDVIHQCLLTLGHVGYSTEHKVGQRLRDVIGLEIGDGTAQVSKLVISRNLLGREYAP